MNKQFVQKMNQGLEDDAQSRRLKRELKFLQNNEDMGTLAKNPKIEAPDVEDTMDATPNGVRDTMDATVNSAQDTTDAISIFKHEPVEIKFEPVSPSKIKTEPTTSTPTPTATPISKLRSVEIKTNPVSPVKIKVVPTSPTPGSHVTKDQRPHHEVKNLTSKSHHVVENVTSKSPLVVENITSKSHHVVSFKMGQKLTPAPIVAISPVANLSTPSCPIPRMVPPPIRRSHQTARRVQTFQAQIAEKIQNVLHGLQS